MLLITPKPQRPQNDTVHRYYISGSELKISKNSAFNKY